MRVSREQFAEHREQILKVAAALFREKGFDGIGVADIMKAAGLTHGGFYGHFASKEDLAAQASRTAGERSAKNWNKVVEDAPEQPLAALVESYLSVRHCDAPSRGCIFAALGADAARQPQAVRTAFAQGLQPLIDILSKVVPGSSKAARRRKALSAMAEMVGAVVLARAVGDPKLAQEILDASSADLRSEHRFA